MGNGGVMGEVRWVFASSISVGTTLTTIAVYWHWLSPNTAMVILIAFFILGAILDVRYGKDN
jgi:Flp pilus assembly protein TadB